MLWGWGLGVQPTESSCSGLFFQSVVLINNHCIYISRQIVPISQWGPGFWELLICTWAITIAGLKGMPLGIFYWDYQFHSWAQAEALRIMCCLTLQMHPLGGSPVPIHKKLWSFQIPLLCPTLTLSQASAFLYNHWELDIVRRVWEFHREP